jgi:hypothetical protein
MSQIQAKENVRLLKEYFEKVTALPGHGGRPSKGAVAREAGLKDRQALYDNEGCVELWNHYSQVLPLRADSAKTSPKEDQLQRENRKLETKNATLQAELFELRRRLRKLECIENLLEEGKRPIP